MRAFIRNILKSHNKIYPENWEYFKETKSIKHNWKIQRKQSIWR